MTPYSRVGEALQNLENGRRGDAASAIREWISATRATARIPTPTPAARGTPTVSLAVTGRREIQSTANEWRNSRLCRRNAPVR